MAKTASKSKDIKPIRVWVTEFSAHRVEALPFAQLPAVNRQYLDVGSGPLETQPMYGDTRYVRVVALDEPVLMMMGAFPDIDPENPPDAADLPAQGIVLPRWSVEYFGVEPGKVLSFSAVPA